MTVRFSTLSDEDLLMALHLRDYVGMPIRDIGVRFGKSKNAMVGALHRVNKDYEGSGPDGNQNGSMGPLWWRR